MKTFDDWYFDLFESGNGVCLNQQEIAQESWDYQQEKINELQKRVDVQTKHIEMALVAVKDIHKSAVDDFQKWDVFTEKTPKLCEHLQNLSVIVGELEQALKGETK